MSDDTLRLFDDLVDQCDQRGARQGNRGAKIGNIRGKKIRFAARTLRAKLKRAQSASSTMRRKRGVAA